MPINLPNLDDLTWQDLNAEGRSLIPATAPEWTNHNASDPGITLMELFAYVSEKLLYQLNRVSDKNVAEFLSLVNGPEWKERVGLLAAEQIGEAELRKALRQAVSTDEKRRTVNTLSETTRAVTPSDFELLARAVPTVARARCIVRRNLDSEDAAARMMEFPSHVSVVILPEGELHPSLELLARIRQKLEPARLLTTRIHVVGPRYISIGCRVTITPVRGTPVQALRDDAVERLKRFLDPHLGWFDGKGWPWGRSVYVSELYQVLSEIDGVDSIAPTRDAQGVFQDEIVVDAALTGRLQRNSRGEIQAVELHPDELLDPRIDPADIVIASHV